MSISLCRRERYITNSPHSYLSLPLARSLSSYRKERSITPSMPMSFYLSTYKGERGRERERDRQTEITASISISLSLYIYIYALGREIAHYLPPYLSLCISISLNTCVYRRGEIDIYIYRYREIFNSLHNYLSSCLSLSLSLPISLSLSLYLSLSLSLYIYILFICFCTLTL